MMMFFLFSAGYGLAQPAIPISPGNTGDVAVVMSGCPSFSWTGQADATAFRVVVFEHDELEPAASYEDTARMKAPVLEREIRGLGLSWTPAGGASLCGGTYLWYVGLVNREGVIEWSEGRIFKVDLLAALNGAGAKCPATVLGVGEEEEAGGEPGNPDPLGGNETGALSLEQLISKSAILYELSGPFADDGAPGEQPAPDAAPTGTEGTSNTFYGYMAGKSIGPDEDRGATFVGASAGTSNTSGYYNTFVGRFSGYSTTTGDNNTFVGYATGYSNTEGHSNTFIGYNAGRSNTTGNGNTFVGKVAGYSNTTGGSNTFLGRSAGSSNTTGG